MAANGRGTLTLNTTAGTFYFVIYPSSGGVLVLEIDIRFLTSGTALQQQTAPFTAGSFTGIYGMNFTGATSGSELDSIAEFTADGVSKLNGIIDINNSGGITFGQPLSGTFIAERQRALRIVTANSVGHPKHRRLSGEWQPRALR